MISNEERLKDSEIIHRGAINKNVNASRANHQNLISVWKTEKLAVAGMPTL